MLRRVCSWLINLLLREGGIKQRVVVGAVMAEDVEAPRAKKLKTDKEEGGSSNENEQDETISQVRRKKCILLLAYCGKGYMGMQKNPGVPTIEGDLMDALWKARAISEAHKDDQRKLGFQRCSRTDKGVSAARLVVSLKITLKKVVKGFDSKKSCSSRLYEYLMPTYPFAPFESTNLAYRITDTEIAKIQALLDSYLGTHRFHNFTSGIKATDPSCNRHIMSFNVGALFVVNDVEFVALSVEGQSFMLHQIRKMIGMVIAIVRGYLNDDAIIRSFEPPKMDIPRAPALGLFLDNVYYKWYNRTYGNDGIHEKLDWTEYEDTIKEFKDNYIYKHIINTELREHTMLQWLQTLQLHDFYQSRSTSPPKTEAKTTENETQEVAHQAETQTIKIETQSSAETDTHSDAKTKSLTRTDTDQTDTHTADSEPIIQK